jgi:hypothetical protein
MADQGLFTWSGISRVKAAKYTQGLGTTPDVIHVEMVPQAVNTFAAYGTATFSFAGVTVPLNECLVDQASLRVDEDAHIGHLRIFDRRWKWRAGGEINGIYNVKDDNNTYIPALQKTAQQLAELCLLAMGETSYSVSALPATAYPQVRWTGAHPATELQELCDQFGCDVVLGYGADPVTIVQLGTGLGAPATSDAVAVNAGLDTDAAPDSVKLSGGPYIFEGMFSMEAVGESLSGALLPLNQLEYRPAHGTWDTGSFEYILLGETASPLTDDQKIKAYNLARNQIFKRYRVTNLAGGYTLGTLPYISALGVSPASMDDVDLLPYRLGTTTDGSRETRLSSQIFGQYAGKSFDAEMPGTTGLANTDCTTSLDPVQTSFKILRDNTVLFSSNVFQLRRSTTTPKATQVWASGCTNLFLWTAFTVSDATTFQQARYTYDDTIRSPAIGTGPKVIHRAEITPYVQLDYNLSGGLPAANLCAPVGAGTYTDNTAAANAEASIWTAAEKAKYSTNIMGWTVYRGLQALKCDGNIRQVTWKVSDARGASTIASVSTESDPFALPASQRRRIMWTDRAFQRRGFGNATWRSGVSQWKRIRRELD